MKHVSELMKQPGVVIEEEDTLSSLLGKLSGDIDPSAVIVNNNKYVGMLNVFELLKSRLDIASMKVRSLAVNAPTLAANDTIVRAAHLFVETPLRSLPVLEDKKVIGVVSQKSVQEHLGLKIPDTTEVTLESSDTLGSAINVLREHKLFAVVVVEKEVPIGVVTIRKLIMRYYSSHQTRDEGMRPNQQTKGFTAEKSSILELPIDSLMQEYTDDIKYLFVTNKQLREAVEQVPSRDLSFVGLDSLSAGERASVEDLFAQLYDKLLVHERYSLKVHLKMYHESGSQQKVSVHLHARTVDGETLKASADGWGLEEAARSSMDKLEWQLRKHAEK